MNELRPVQSEFVRRAPTPMATARRQSRPLRQPRILLAAVQPPRAGGIAEPAAIRCSSACASCRSRPPISTSSSWCASPASPARCARASPSRARTAARPSSSSSSCCVEVEQLQEDQQESLSGLMLLLKKEGIEIITGRCADQGRAGLAGGPFPGTGLPGADAAVDRPGASVPVHSQSRLLDRAAAAPPARTARR